MCSPGSRSATPITPQNGSTGIRIERPSGARPSSSTDQIWRWDASPKSSASSPMPGNTPVHAQSSCSMARISASSTSPGSAPSTDTGPVRQCTASQGRAIMSSTVEPFVSPPP